MLTFRVGFTEQEADWLFSAPAREVALAALIIWGLCTLCPEDTVNLSKSLSWQSLMGVHSVFFSTKKSTCSRVFGKLHHNYVVVLQLHLLESLAFSRVFQQPLVYISDKDPPNKLGVHCRKIRWDGHMEIASDQTKTAPLEFCNLLKSIFSK